MTDLENRTNLGFFEFLKEESKTIAKASLIIAGFPFIFAANIPRDEELAHLSIHTRIGASALFCLPASVITLASMPVIVSLAYTLCYYKNNRKLKRFKMENPKAYELLKSDYSFWYRLSKQVEDSAIQEYQFRRF